MSGRRGSYVMVADDDPYWVQFWSVYPRHEAKLDARKAWAVLKPDAALVHKMLGTLLWQVPHWETERFAYAPLPATWLRGARWDDECPQAVLAQRPDARGHVPPCRTNTECNRKLEAEIAARRASYVAS